MNRRKAISRIIITSLSGGILFSGYKWYDWNKIPDISYLERNRALLASLAATIIPAGDSPGAKEAGVHDFIVHMIKDCTDRISANKFIDGLKDLQHFCSQKYNRSYDNCSEEEKTSVLNHFQEKGKPLPGIAGKVQNRYTGRSFFSTLKEYTVKGYCTSQAGATRGLAYVPVPGGYQGCIPKLPGQRAWATK